jgi:hypothetical protein
MKLIVGLFLSMFWSGLAQAGDFAGAEVIGGRSKIVGHYEDYGDGGEVIEVAVRTYENSSRNAVRIYRLRQDITGAIVRAVLHSAEGPVGP